MIMNILYLVAGIMVGIFVYAQMLLPLFYGLPVSILMVAKRQLKFRGILFQLVTPAIWFIGLIGLGLVLSWVWPGLLKFFIYNPAFNAGTGIGFILILANLFTSSGRKSIREDFNDVTVARFAL